MIRRYFISILAIALLMLSFGCGGGGGGTSSRVESVAPLAATSTTLVADGNSYTTITALATDASGKPLPNADVEFSTTLGTLEVYNVPPTIGAVATIMAVGSAQKVTARTNMNGKAAVRLYPGRSTGVATVTSFVNGIQQQVNVTFQADPTYVPPSTEEPVEIIDLAALTLTALNNSIAANGTDVVAIDLSASNRQQQPMSGVPITVTTTAGSLSRTSGGDTAETLLLATGTSGIVRFYLRSGTQATTAAVHATAGGVSTSTTVALAPGAPFAATSSLIASPSALPANGTAETEVTVTLRDQYSNIIMDGREVTLQATAGVITSQNPIATSSGRATFTLRAPSTPSEATLSLMQYPSISRTITFGSVSSNAPANIEMSLGTPNLYVAGVGKSDATSISLTVRDAAGSPIADPDAGVNNLRVAFRTHPGAPETLSGTSATGLTVSNDSIEVRTNGGVATITLQAGTLPGVVELEIEAFDEFGNPLSPRVLNILPQITIASGPPHSIALSYPVTGSITNLGTGFYRRAGSASVTDRYGNAVPDGTAINLGLLDSVIASGSDGATSAASNILSVGTTVLTTASVTRNGVLRYVQSNDRVLLFNTVASDKSRFVGTTISASQVSVNKAYQSSVSGVEYLMGASLLGGQVHGVNAQTEAMVAGHATVKDGLAQFFVTYPANQQAINAGCYYGNHTVDTRHLPAGSAQVWIVAEATDSGATTIDNRFCFAPVLGYTLTNESGITTISTNNDTTAINFSLVDGNAIPLPFLTISPLVTIVTNTGAFQVQAVPCTTDTNGQCAISITVTGGTLGGAIDVGGNLVKDSAVVTISAPGNATPVEVQVAIP
ncbi:Ig-like domain-containing protein [Chrysiogenes arsenatis]|uniref:Ig-like domain-containing protein n=1 Tax=Chrysiogenes arsenatis TaxID=309797 RepID=UPI000410B8CF|nr:invasin domain 3-containing protein [Chrysiogenes arsenatis]